MIKKPAYSSATMKQCKRYVFRAIVSNSAYGATVLIRIKTHPDQDFFIEQSADIQYNDGE
jgi:hypothetical protein